MTNPPPQLQNPQSSVPNPPYQNSDLPLQVNTVVSAPQSSPPPTPESAMITPPESQKKASYVLPLTLLAVFFLLTIGLGAGGYAVAYNKLSLPQSMEKVQVGVTNFVQSLPFTPKTPEFLIAKALSAQDKVNKESYNISLALESQNVELIPQFGSSIDIEAKGNIDYSDRENIRFTLDANITKDFSFQLVKPDSLLYFKIGKIPSLLLSFAGLKPQYFDPVINKWFFYDTAPLETEARKEIKENSGDREVLSDKFVKDNLDNYVDDRILSAMKVTQDSVDGFEVYKITISADTELIDYIGKKIEEEENKGSSGDYMRESNSKKLSDIVKSMNWEVNIDKREYYVRKVAITAQVEVDEIESYDTLFLGSPGMGSQPSNAHIAMAAIFGDFGKDVTIAKPDGAKSWEEFTNALSEIFRKQYEESIGGAYYQATDAKTKSDLMQLRSALELYRADNDAYPTNLDALSPDYIWNIPEDPTGNAYYYNLTEGTNYDLCGTLHTPDPANDNCPDPRYNYHLTTP